MGFNLKGGLINMGIKLFSAYNSLRKNTFGMCERIHANEISKIVGRSLPPHLLLAPIT